MSKININGKNISEKEFDELTCEERLEKLNNDLGCFLFILNLNPSAVMRHTAVLSTEDVCYEKLKKIIEKGNHKIGEKDWCCGFLGSRWIDIKIGKDNDELYRLAFYSKKFNPEWFEPDNPYGSQISNKKYLLMVIPN